MQIKLGKYVSINVNTHAKYYIINLNNLWVSSKRL